MAARMNLCRHTFVMALWIFFTLLGVSPLTYGALAIKHVELLSDVVDPKSKLSASVRFTLTEPATVTLSIYDARDQRIYASQFELAKGIQTLSWNGLDTNGESVPPEAYIYTLKAQSHKTETEKVEYDLTDHTGGKALRKMLVEWRPEANEVMYKLNESARVNLRVGIKGGPILETLLDWVPRTKGVHTIAWGGYDRDKRVDISKHPRLSLVADAFTLPKNTIYVLPEVARPQFIEVSEPQHVRVPKKVVRANNIHQLSLRAAEYRRDYKVNLKFLGDKKNRQLNEKIPVINGRVAIEISVANEDKALLNSSRYEVAIFVDGVYHYENEIAFLPMTYYWDAASQQVGEHFISVNIMSFDGNFGFATRKVRVEH